MNKNDFVSDRRLYLDKDHNVVEADDPNKLTLLVAEGGRLSQEDVEKYGLNTEAEPEAENVSAASSDAENEPPDDLESKTKAELLEMAGARGVDVKTSQTKAEILAALQGE